MSTPKDPATEQRREHARRNDGKFGEQMRGEANFETPTATDNAALYPDIETWEPTRVDTEIARLHTEGWPLQDRINDNRRKGKSYKYRAAYGDKRAEERLADASKLQAEYDEKYRKPLDELDSEFSRRGTWSRFFIVGHFHTSQFCSSFRPTTRIGWLPEYSGRSNEEMIEAAGDMVCTICVPEAPVRGKRPTLPELAEEWDKKAAAADGKCSGSGKYADKTKPSRTGYYTGNWGHCPDCGEQVTLLKPNYKIRQHKRPT